MKPYAKHIAVASVVCGLAAGASLLPCAPVASYTQAYAQDAQNTQAYTFKDKAFEKIIRQKLGKSEKATITAADLEKITSLEINGATDVKNWSDVTELKGLVSLTIQNSKLAGAELNVVGLNKLEGLYLPNNKITQLPPLPQSVKYLNLNNNELESIAQLPDQIELLRANNNKLTDISGVANKASLQELYLTNNQLAKASITDLTSLENNAKLLHLELSGNKSELLDDFQIKKLQINVNLAYQLWKLEHGTSGSSGSYDGIIRALQNADTESASPYAMLFRIYNPYTGEHLFTTKKDEAIVCIKAGWHAEGVAGIVSMQEGVAVYRLYNPYTGDHHYTTSVKEVETCVSNGWRNEGVAFRSTSSSAGKAMISMYNPYASSFYHHYTSDVQEIATMEKAGWINEGAKWYVVK